MNSFYFIIPIALVFCVIAIKAFFWAIDNRQFDDLENEGRRILFDDDLIPPKTSASVTPPPEHNQDDPPKP